MLCCLSDEREVDDANRLCFSSVFAWSFSFLLISPYAATKDIAATLAPICSARGGTTTRVGVLSSLSEMPPPRHYYNPNPATLALICSARGTTNSSWSSLFFLRKAFSESQTYSIIKRRIKTLFGFIT
jgi:hypothetical protein